MGTLAIDGGEKLRTSPMPSRHIGSNILGQEEENLLIEAIRSKTLFRHYGPGKPHFVHDFEDEFAGIMNSKYALATATGSGSLFCAMRALELPPGSEVIIPAFGWITDFNMAVLNGCVPVFCQVDHDYNISPEDFKTKITDKTKAVVVIHYQGLACRIDEIVEIAQAHGIKVIEDAAQAMGGEYKGKKLGTFGDIGCFSLQGSKILTTGDGGILITEDQVLFEKCVRFQDLGSIRPHFLEKLEKEVMTEAFCGMQFRMNELSGAVALASTRKLPWIVEQCRKHLKLFTQLINAALPEIEIRGNAENNMGILMALDLKNNENVGFFAEAFSAEGLNYGATSGCGTMNLFDPVNVWLKNNPQVNTAIFDETNKIIAGWANIAILPVYSDQDIKDLADGAVKIINEMKKREML